MRYNPFTRRQFLIGTGQMLLPVPVLISLLPKAYAQSLVTRKRFFCLAYDNGRHAPHWYPAESEDPKFTAVANVPYMREMPIKNIPGNISQVFGSRFNGSIRDRLTLIRGLDGMWVNKQGHQTSTVLAGNLGAGQNTDWESKYGPSIDYIMSKNVKSNPDAKPNSSLHLGVTSNFWDISYRYDVASNKMIPAGRELNPMNAFNSLFKSAPAPTPANTRPQKVIDRVLASYKSVVNNPKLSGADKLLLNEHVEMIHQLENSFSANPPPAACTAPAAPGGQANGADAYSIERVNKQNIDIMIAAVKCGIVNIGTIMLSSPVDNTIYSNLGLSLRFHDDYSHKTMDSPEILKITSWMADQFGYFISGLNVPEPGTNGTYLDNSLVLFGNAMGGGSDHTYYDMPVMLAGGLGGRFRAGRYIDYSNRAKRNTAYGGGHSSFQGRNYCALLVTLMQAMGLSQADYQQANVSEGFGSDTYEQGNIEAWRLDRKNPLPGLLVGT